MDQAAGQRVPSGGFPPAAGAGVRRVPEADAVRKSGVLCGTVRDVSAQERSEVAATCRAAGQFAGQRVSLFAPVGSAGTGCAALGWR